MKDTVMIEVIKLVAQVTSTLVALSALVIAFRNESRNQRRFNVQLSQSRKVAQAAVRPLLIAERHNYENNQAVILANQGPGVAIVSSLHFTTHGSDSTNVGDLLEVPQDLEIMWNENTDYGERTTYIAAKSSEEAFQITDAQLEECGVQPKRALAFLQAVKKQLDEMEVSFEYEDIFGKKFKDTFSLE